MTEHVAPATPPRTTRAPAPYTRALVRETLEPVEGRAGPVAALSGSALAMIVATVVGVLLSFALVLALIFGLVSAEVSGDPTGPVPAPSPGPAPMAPR